MAITHGFMKGISRGRLTRDPRPRIGSGPSSERRGWLGRTFLILGVLCSGGVASFAAKASLNAFFPVDFKDPAYQKKAFAQVQKAWVKPGVLPTAGKKAVVRAMIGRDGSLIASALHLGSGVKEWDGAALAAIKKAAPFPPLPDLYKGSQVEVHWHFATVP